MESDVYLKDPQILSSANGKSRPEYTPCEVLNHAILLPNPRGLSLLSLLPRKFGPLDKTPRGIVRRSSDQS